MKLLRVVSWCRLNDRNERSRFNLHFDPDLSFSHDFFLWQNNFQHFHLGVVFSDCMVFSSFGHGYNVFTLNAATCCKCLAAWQQWCPVVCTTQSSSFEISNLTSSCRGRIIFRGLIRASRPSQGVSRWEALTSVCLMSLHIALACDCHLFLSKL